MLLTILCVFCVHAGELGMLDRVAAALLAVWRRNAGSARLALPLLRCADLLYTEGGLEDLPCDSFPGGCRCITLSPKHVHEVIAVTCACTM